MTSGLRSLPNRSFCIFAAVDSAACPSLAPRNLLARISGSRLLKLYVTLDKSLHISLDSEAQLDSGGPNL
jgi:hypothetical protein